MKILVACEESQTVCKAFRARGHEAYSCDVVECSGGHPEWHLQQDVIPLLKEKWDMVIAFPPCPDICVSGARWFAAKIADGRQQRAIDFFMAFTRIDCPRVAIENPVGIMSTHYRKPDQIIQPFEHGDPYRKATCLWLKNLPLLIATNIVEGREQKCWKEPPGPDRSKRRSKTYQGIANAIATQWSDLEE